MSPVDPAQHVRDWSAGFGQFMTRLSVNGPGTARFEIAIGVRSLVFCGNAELAWAVYLSGEPVTPYLPSEQVLRLAMAGTGLGDYVTAAQREPGGPARGWSRYQLCNGLANQVVSLTYRPQAFPAFPHLHPEWRMNHHDEIGSTGAQAPAGLVEVVACQHARGVLCGRCIESDPEYRAHAAHGVPRGDCSYCPDGADVEPASSPAALVEVTA